VAAAVCTTSDRGNCRRNTELLRTEHDAGVKTLGAEHMPVEIDEASAAEHAPGLEGALACSTVWSVTGSSK